MNFLFGLLIALGTGLGCFLVAHLALFIIKDSFDLEHDKEFNRKGKRWVNTATLTVFVIVLFTNISTYGPRHSLTSHSSGYEPERSEVADNPADFGVHEDRFGRFDKRIDEEQVQ